jgi:hypothetical protein
VKQIEREPAAVEVIDLPPTGLSDGAETAERDDNVNVVRRFFRPQTIISFLFSFAVLVFFLTRINIDLDDVLARMRTADPAFLLLAFAAYYLSFPVRAMRWRMLLGNAGLRRAENARLPGLPGLTEMIFLSWFANCIVPAKLGDAYRSYLLKQRARVSFSTTIGTILTERITDVLVLFGLMALAGLIAFHGHLPSELLYLMVFGGVLVGIVVAGLVMLRSLRPLAARLLPARVHSFYHKFEQGILQSFRPQTIPHLLVYTGIVWLLEGLRLYCVALALGLKMPLSVTLFIALASSLLTTIPFTPAGLGFVESAVVTVLLWFRVDQATAVSVSFLDRIISYWSIIVFGVIVYVIGANRERLGRWLRRPGSVPNPTR